MKFTQIFYLTFPLFFYIVTCTCTSLAHKYETYEKSYIYVETQIGTRVTPGKGSLGSLKKQYSCNEVARC